MKQKMPRVFITQESPSADYTPAVAFGDLVFVTANSQRLSPHSASLGNVQIIDGIRTALADFDKDDYLICTGAPAHMAICAAFLGDKLRNILVWDNRTTAYFVVRI